MVYTGAMDITTQQLLEQEQFFRDNVEGIAEGNSAVLDELYSTYEPSLDRDRMIEQAKVFLSETVHGNVVYNIYWSLSNVEAIRVSQSNEQQQHAAALKEIREIHDETVAAYDKFLELSNRRTNLVMSVLDAGVTQADMARATGISRQRLAKLALRAREKQQ